LVRTWKEADLELQSLVSRFARGGEDMPPPLPGRAAQAIQQLVRSVQQSVDVWAVVRAQLEEQRALAAFAEVRNE
jgi:hypothetical protein